MGTEHSSQHFDTVVRVSGFVKRYKKHVAVDGVDLEIRKGEVYGLIGPDGAGKSSLMKAMAGVLTYDGGSVEVFGTVVDSEWAAERVKQRLGFLPQGLGLNLYPDLSVEENIDFFARLRLVPESDLASRKRRLLSMTRLETFRDRAMKNLPGGMKQKLGLICTLIHEPELAILDEPTTGVDPVSRRNFWAILAELLQEKGMTALVSTAYMDEAARFHRLSFVSSGKVLVSGTPADVQALVPGSIVTFEATPQLTAIHRLKQAYQQVDALGAKLHVFEQEIDREQAVRNIEACLGDVHPVQVRVDEPELEDVFVSLLLRKTESQEAVTVPSRVNRAEYFGLAIEARKLVRDFGSFRAVDHVSFKVKQGEIFGLLGANGAGKTTVIKMLNGILSPTGGEGWVAGADMKTAGDAIKERIGYMSQAFSLYLDLTVEENIRLFAGIYGLDRQATTERLAWIVSMAGLRGYETSLTGRLPMGVRQRLALGCALVHQPRVLFLDEPTSGVDPIGRRYFWDILARLAREEGVAMLVTTHYMSEADHCDQFALMYAGRIVAEGSPQEMRQQVEAEAGHLMELTTDQPGVAVRRLAQVGFSGAALFGTKIHLFTRNPREDDMRIREVLSDGGVRVNSISQRPLSLEDVFVHRIMVLEQQEHEAARGADA
ncbi:MAG: ABC transporter ATP-binding protein [Nitrospira sp.]|nr:ABC transporter ATP-binding protein [Nitrospira sp.]